MSSVKKIKSLEVFLSSLSADYLLREIIELRGMICSSLQMEYIDFAVPVKDKV